MERKLWLQLGVLFLITQLLGLYVGSVLIEEEVSTPIVTDDPEDIENSIGLFLYILLFTAALLLIVVFVKGRLLWLVLKGLETVAIWGTSLIVFGAFIWLELAVILALVVVILRNVFPKHMLLRNLTSILAVAGAGALIGVSLGLLPIIIFFVLGFIKSLVLCERQ